MQIVIENLSDGTHTFHLEEDSDALELPRDEASFDAPVIMDITLSISGDNLVLQGRMTTMAGFSCSRCLTDFRDQIAGELTVLYEKTDRTTRRETSWFDSDDVEELAFDAKTIELKHRVEELIHLSMPLKPLCREECRGLCPQCGVDLNNSSCDCRNQVDDPRWQALKEVFKEE